MERLLKGSFPADLIHFLSQNTLYCGGDIHFWGWGCLISGRGLREGSCDSAKYAKSRESPMVSKLGLRQHAPIGVILGLYWVYMGIMDKKMEITIMGYIGFQLSSNHASACCTLRGLSKAYSGTPLCPRLGFRPP